MPQPRKLTLKKETLTALTTDELRRVAGADLTAGITQPVKLCVTELLSCTNCVSWDTEQCWDPA